MDLTPEQQAAIYTHDHNLIVVAGAGSGKTHVLVERYLSLLDTNPSWSLNALVAITFTKKAAQEMRDRVRVALEKRLAEAFDETASDCWATRLAAMDSARIDTIHALCADLLRANAAEAQVDPDFAVLDEIDAQGLVENAVDDVLRTLAAENDQALELVSEYNQKKVTDTLASLIAVEIEDVPDHLFELWQAQWQENAGSQLLKFVMSLSERPIWPPVGDDQMSKSWQIVADNLAFFAERREQDILMGALRQLAAMKMPPRPARVWGADGDSAKGDLQRLRDLARAILQAIGEPPNALDERAARLLPLWASVIRQAQDAYRQMKRQQSLLDFDDLETLTCRLLRENPNVRARYALAEFKHLLVDEFQDTNGAQWEIVQALAAPEQPGCLFVVGDARQSIYAFRGADVSVFGQVKQQIIGAGGQEVSLMRSFRTHQPLVLCFNSIFGRILIRDENSPAADYEIELGEPLLAQREMPPTDSPTVEFLLIDDLEKLAGDSDGRRRWEAYEIGQRLQQMVEVERRLIFDKKKHETRSVEYGDIALLFQALSRVTLYEDVFKALGLPFVTVSGRGYYDRQEVWDLLNLLRALYNPADNLSLAAALRSPLFSLSDDALFALRLDANISLWDALAADAVVEHIPQDERPLVTFARNCLYDLRTKAGRITISELLRDALERTGYLATLTGLPDGARRRGNVEKLLDKARDSGKTTLGAFSRYLNDLSAREAREGEALLEVSGAVTLMSVHKSKGLEYPVIVLADTSWKGSGPDDAIVTYDRRYGLTCKVIDPAENKAAPTYAYREAAHLRQMREEAERKRLLYVAATRAQDALVISGQISAEKKGGYKAAGWLGWLLDAFELSARELPEDGVLPFSWGEARIHRAVTPPAEEALTADSAALAEWGETAAAEPHAPDLLREILVEPDAPARSLTATQMADLGGAGIDPFYRYRFRRSVFHDAPAHIDAISVRKAGDSYKRTLGEIVHKMLRHWRFPGQDSGVDQLLESYAWEEGIVQEAERHRAVVEARHLLASVTRSDVYRWLETADEVYRELPFVYRRDKRLIHGIIDVLFRRKDRSWAIVDYKTGQTGMSGTPLAEHARRYYLQVAIYADAVRQQLGVVPDVFIYYIRHKETLKIAPEDWQLALDTLEMNIENIITGQ